MFLPSRKATASQSCCATTYDMTQPHDTIARVILAELKQYITLNLWNIRVSRTFASSSFVQNLAT
jgi:hypothetical protein